MKEKNIICDLWNYLDRPNLPAKELKVFNWLNKDNLSSIMIDDKVFYMEKTSELVFMPNYVYDWIKNWVRHNYKLTYLYDLTNNL
jgi:hypothetical protein